MFLVKKDEDGFPKAINLSIYNSLSITDTTEGNYVIVGTRTMPDGARRVSTLCRFMTYQNANDTFQNILMAMSKDQKVYWL